MHKAMYDNEPVEKVKAVFIRLNARHDTHHQETKCYLGLLGDTDIIESRLVTLEVRSQNNSDLQQLMLKHTVVHLLPIIPHYQVAPLLVFMSSARVTICIITTSIYVVSG